MNAITEPELAVPPVASGGARPRVLSGIQPTADSFHFGNYLGATRQWVDLQRDHQPFFFIADLHAITVEQDPGVLRERTLRAAAQLLAMGIDPKRSAIFVQSQIPAHAQLSWVLQCLTGFGEARRMTQFKDKSSKSGEGAASVGLFTYPILQAADILLYDATHIPVGEDQKQHIELARDVALRFNSLYGETFVVPEGVIPEVGARVMGLDDPTQKMSKSAQGKDHAVSFTDTDDDIVRTIKRAVTDSGRDIVFSDAPEKAGVKNLLTIYQSLTSKTRAEVASRPAADRHRALRRFAIPRDQHVGDFLQLRLTDLISNLFLTLVQFRPQARGPERVAN